MTITRQLPVLATLAAVVLVATLGGCTGSSPSGADRTPGTTPPATGSPPASTPPAATNPAPTRPAGKAALSTAKAGTGLRAESLRSSTRCGPPGTQDSYADLTWKPAATSGTQRVVYSPYADGYRTGRYEVTADLAPGATRVTVKELSPGSTYTWLVLTRHGDRWDASATAQFMGPICTVDGN